MKTSRALQAEREASRKAAGEAIRRARESADLSQVDLATRMGVVPSTVAGWELGTHGIRMDKIARLAKVLKTSVSTLIEAA